MNTHIILLFIVTAFSCRHAEISAQIPYDIAKPERKYSLPAKLNEVSGLTDLDTAHLAMVQDELGLIFIFKLSTGEIIRELPFDSFGDFEGLTYTGNALFILRSDGRLTEWKGFNQAGAGTIVQHSLPLVTMDNEGLCYDKKHKKLLIAAKSKPEDPTKKSERYIYAYDLATQKLDTKIKYSLNLEKLSASAKQFRIPLAVNAKGKPKAFNFRPSSLAIHPGSGLIYILSATDQMLIVINESGEVKSMQSLDPRLFGKAEGITFLEDGTMIISNEANGGVATVLKFEVKS